MPESRWKQICTLLSPEMTMGYRVTSPAVRAFGTKLISGPTKTSTGFSTSTVQTLAPRARTVYHGRPPFPICGRPSGLQVITTKHGLPKAHISLRKQLLQVLKAKVLAFTTLGYMVVLRVLKMRGILVNLSSIKQLLVVIWDRMIMRDFSTTIAMC